MTSMVFHPQDAHDRALLKNARPDGWVNPAPKDRYHLVVIGAGTAGLVTAAGAAGLGAKVALVEKHIMGGDCLNYGCVPSKAMIRSARAAEDVRRSAECGVKVPPGAVIDFPAVMERMRRLRATISPHDSADRFRNLGVDVFFGEGRFSGRDTVDVDGAIPARLRFKKAVIATGSSAALPPIPGLMDANPLTNETVFSLTVLPPRLAVIGAGSIGCEMAQTFKRFGSDVHLIEQAPRILPREDAAASRLIQKTLALEGVAIHPGSHVVRVERSGKETTISLKKEGQVYAVHVDSILVGAGRVPNIDGLNLERAGVEYDRTGVWVNERLQTANPRVYAAGDVCSSFKFTHAADFYARIVIQNAMFFGRAKAKALTIPWCTYTDPELAHVGLTEEDARDRGIEIETFTCHLDDIDRAVLDGDTNGFVKIHVRKGTDRILGATIVAAHAGEMINEITLAMTCGKGLGTIAKTIHPYPTQAEAIRRAGDQWNKTRLTPFVKSLLRVWLKII